MSFKQTLQPPSERALKAWSVIRKAIKLKRPRLSSISLPDYKSQFRIVKNGFKIPKYQNTYRLESYNPFQCEVGDKILREVMQNYLGGLKYHPQVCLEICQKISNEVRDKICKKNYDRSYYCCSQIQGCSYHFDCSEVRPKRSDRFWQIMGHSQRHVLNSRDRDSRLRRDGPGRGNLLRINVSRRSKILRIPKFLRHYGVLKLNKNKKKVE